MKVKIEGEENGVGVRVYEVNEKGLDGGVEGGSNVGAADNVLWRSACTMWHFSDR